MTWSNESESASADGGLTLRLQRTKQWPAANELGR